MDAFLVPPLAKPGQISNLDYRRIVLLVAAPAVAVFVPSLWIAGVPQDLWLPFTVISTAAAVFVSATFLVVPSNSMLSLVTPIGNGLVLAAVGIVLRPYFHSIELLLPLVISGHAILHGLGPAMVAVAVGTLVAVYAFGDPGTANLSEVIYSAIYLTGSALLPWTAWRLATRHARLLGASERESATRRTRLEAVLHSMDDAVVVVDGEGNALMANPAYEAMAPTMRGGLESLTDGGRRNAKDLLPEARAARGETFELDFVGREPSGERRWFEARGGPIRDELGREAGLVVIRDITDRSRRLQQEQFMATASHELRTPIAALHGYVQLLARHLDPQAQPREAEYARMAISQTRRVGQLLDQLFDLARLQTGRLEVLPEATDLRGVAENAISTLAPLTVGRELRLDPGPEPVIVMADPGRLEQVLVNLLMNALQHAPKSQLVDVAVRTSAGRGMVSVRDYGLGMTPERQAEVLGSDRRVMAEGPAQQLGLGLGLFISRELVRAQAGSLEVTSQLGAGSTFTINLPLVQ